MKYLFIIVTLLSISLNQKTDKLNGRYNYLIEEDNSYIQKDKITFKDSVLCLIASICQKEKFLMAM